MLSALPAPLRGIIASILLAINTLFWCLLLYVVALIKLIPWKPLQALSTKVIILIGEVWIAFNSGWMKLTQTTRWRVDGLEGLRHEGWYLVICNHQSWVDIFALQHTLNRRIPFLKFFLKKELIWVPVIGLAWWGLDFPFMKRYSPEYLKRHPHLRGKDMETTRKACEKFRTTPVSVMNFIEGTRFTPAKHQQQQSPFQYLLPPKAGGTGFVLEAMGDSLSTVLDVTIVYPAGKPTLWSFMCGSVPEIVMHLERKPIPAELLGKSYADDPAQREQVKNWLLRLWQDKDARIGRILERGTE